MDTPVDETDETGTEDPCEAKGATCDGQTGLCGPIPTCTATNPCQLDSGPVTEPISVPTCKTSTAARWHAPATASTSRKLPLVLFFHGAGGGADDAYNATMLRLAADSADLTGDRARPGFVLISDQGRNSAYPGAQQVGHHDDLFRRYDQNPDVRQADRLIDEAVATGVVDPKRIYVMGWSNGGFFAQAYGILRHRQATADGNRVAAVVAYTAADPFQGVSSDEPECSSPYPETRVPIQLVHRSCDIVACDQDQAAIMGLGPGYVVEPWLATLRTTMNTPSVEDVIVDTDGKKVGACMATPPCTEAVGVLNHIRWPDGAADRGDDHQPGMFAFLRSHPLP